MRKRYIYPEEQIRTWIAEGKTQQAIGEILGIQTKLIQKFCKSRGIKCQRTGPRAGEGHPEWNGGRISMKGGYVGIYMPDHPSCIQANAVLAQKHNGKYFRKKRYVLEHRLVMEAHLGRYLSPDEVVHHINGNVQDNRLENLELFSSNAEHLRDTLKGKCPNWTESGKEAIREAVNLVAHIRRSQRERGEPLKRETKIRPLIESHKPADPQAS